MDQILKILKKRYKNIFYYLKFDNNFQLMIGTILSAQTTDKQVNKVLKELFKKYPKPQDLANANIKEIEKIIKSTGFYKNKAKNIKNTSKLLVTKYNQKVPNTLNELIKFPGIGRKTANVILQNGFKQIKGIIVDTHVIRLSKRFGWTKQKNPDKIEKDLMLKFPKKEWKNLPHLLKSHGKAYCKAPTPICTKCFINTICPKINVKKNK